jgi:hypothetical protein
VTSFHNVKEIFMKRTISFLSFLLVFTALAFAQPSQAPMGANCPMARNGICNGEKCCKGGCDKKCCDDKGAKMCSKDNGAKQCCQKGSGKNCCHHSSSQGATQPDTGAASKGVQK